MQPNVPNTPKTAEVQQVSHPFPKIATNIAANFVLKIPNNAEIGESNKLAQRIDVVDFGILNRERGQWLGNMQRQLDNHREPVRGCNNQAYIQTTSGNIGLQNCRMMNNFGGIGLSNDGNLIIVALDNKRVKGYSISEFNNRFLRNTGLDILDLLQDTDRRSVESVRNLLFRLNNRQSYMPFDEKTAQLFDKVNTNDLQNEQIDKKLNSVIPTTSPIIP